MSQIGIEADHFDPQQVDTLPRGLFGHPCVDQFAEDFTIIDSADHGVGENRPHSILSRLPVEQREHGREAEHADEFLLALLAPLCTPGE